MYPEIPVAPGLSISTYFLTIALGTIAASLFFVRRASSRKLERTTSLDLTLVVLISGFFGARALHVFYEDFSYYIENPVAVLYVWNGGFVFLGGLLAAWAAAVLFCNIKREPFWFWADAAAPPIALAYGLGRLACFFNGCCYGRECDLPWAVNMAGYFRHPAQLYASFWELSLMVVLIKLEPKLRMSGVLFNVWLLGHALGRLIMEAFRADPRGDLILGLSIGTWMSVVLGAFAGYNLLNVLLPGKKAS